MSFKAKNAKAGLAVLLALFITLTGGCGAQDGTPDGTQSAQSAAGEEGSGEFEFVLDDSGNLTPAQEYASIQEDAKKSQSGGDSFRMSIAGDYIIYDSTYAYANVLADGNGYDFKPMVRNLRQFTENCDVNYYNQETILGGTEIGLSSYPCFCSPQEAGDAMVDLGYNLVSTATNHTMDAGEDAILVSCKYWKKQAEEKGVFMTGSFDSQKARDEVHILECNGITYTMLDYTYGTNGIPVPEGKEYLVNVWPCGFTSPDTDEAYQAYKKQVKKDIDAVRDKVDFLIVCMHAGIEYAVPETDYQDDMAKFLADSGVNLVIGTHPHVIEPAEYIGDTLVYYSMGNLFCAQMQDENYNKVTSILATLTVKKTVENGKTKITFENVENNLMYCYYNQATWSDYLIVPFSSPDIAHFLPDYENVYEHYKEIFLMKDKSLTVVPCAKAKNDGTAS